MSEAKRKAILVIGPSIAYMPLTKGLFACVDSDVVPELEKYNWQARISGKRKNRVYAWRKVGKSIVMMHRQLMGDLEPGLMVDHRNPNRTLDNRRGNLRPATPLQNSQNQLLCWDSTTGAKGVWFYAKRNRYVAQIRHMRKSIHCGYHRTLEAAKAAYEAKAIELRGEYARWGHD